MLFKYFSIKLLKDGGKLILLMLSFLVSLSFASGAVFDGGDRIEISENINDDLYVTGDEINVHARIAGDLIGSGRSFLINDTIQGDLIVMSEQLVINGEIKDDVRFLGRLLRISGNILGDVIVMAGEVQIDPDVIIGGDLILNGGKLNLEGVVKGKVLVRSESASIRGTIEDSLNITSAKSVSIVGSIKGPVRIAANSLIIHPGESKFYRDVEYWSGAGEVDFSGVLVNAKAVYNPELEIDQFDWKYFGLHPIVFFLALLLTGLVCVLFFNYFFSETLFRAGTHLQVSPGRSVGWGALYFLGLPFIIFILTIVIVGIPIAVLLLGIYIFSVLFGMIITSIIVSNYILVKRNKSRKFWKVGFLSLLVWVVLNIIILVPFIGFLFIVLLTFASFGAIILKLLEDQKLRIIQSRNFADKNMDI